MLFFDCQHPNERNSELIEMVTHSSVVFSFQQQRAVVSQAVYRLTVLIGEGCGDYMKPERNNFPSSGLQESRTTLFFCWFQKIPPKQANISHFA